MIQGGLQVLVLVPEIALTPQTVLRFQNRFGNHVGLWHSSLTDSDRAKTWHAVRRGEVSIVVGVRSAIFLPFERLGLVVLDEEHEGTYKQEEHPRYHTRDVAFWLADHTGAKVILGSATPSLETAFYARQNLIGWIRMTRRIGHRTLPPVEIVDMRQELQEGNHSIFSRALQYELTRALNRQEQAILFLNRRGYASFVMCRDCGRAVQCPNCAVTLTYHQNLNQLMCHYCFFIMTLPKVCNHCGSHRIRYFGAGTERVVEEVQKLWPAARVLRADRDTLTSRQSYFQMYQDFMEQRADVLVGTQMIAKGMDFTHVSVVGIVAADVALHLPDFRRSERTFQLLVQASGRTGRGEDPGKVVVQAYEPEHFAIQSARSHSYDGFYQKEIEYRKELGYPPYGNLWLLEVTDTSDDRAQKTMARVADKVGILSTMGLQILGPAPAPVPKVRGRFRYHILLKGSRTPEMMAILSKIEHEELSCSITVDPYYML
jgi:primosomal protein N' (replication factor Y)